MSTSVLVANEHQLVREALRALIESRGDLRVVAQAADGQQAVELTEEHRPDIVIMDVAMPRLSAAEATRRIAGGQSGSRVLILGTRDSRARLDEALRAGASGCLLKESDPKEVFEAIDVVGQGQFYLSPSATEQVVDTFIHGRPSEDSPLFRLTEREREVLRLIAEGHSSKEIGDMLGVSIKTVDSHRAALMKKLGIHKASALVLFAIREGLVEP